MKSVFRIFLIMVVASLAVRAQSVSALALGLHLNKAVYILGEPFTATFSVTDGGQSTPIRFSFSLEGDLQLLVRQDSDRRYQRCFPWSGATYERGAPSATQLPPEGIKISQLFAYSSDTSISSALRHFFFAVPGRKFFKATLRIADGVVIESNEVVVEVVVPESRDAEAWEKWQDPIYALMVQGTAIKGDPYVAEGLEKLRVFADKYPNTLYAEYARARLAEDVKIAPEQIPVLQGATAVGPAPTPASGLSAPPQVPATPVPPPEGGLRGMLLLSGVVLFVALLVWWLRRR
jgi:hypothetical protein